MFKFLKDKLKQAVGLFTKEVKEKAVEEDVDIEEKPKLPQRPAKVPPKKVKKTISGQAEKPKPIEQKKLEKTSKPTIEKTGRKAEPSVLEEKSEPPIKEKKPLKKSIEPVQVKKPEKLIPELQKEEPKAEDKKWWQVWKKEELNEETSQEESKAQIEEKQGFFTRLKEKVTKIQLSEDKFEEIFQPLEIALLENNVALEVVEKIKKDLHDELLAERIHRKQVEQIVHDTLKKSIEDLFSVEGVDLLKKVKEKKPYIIAFFGVNGSGKTTTIAKFANLFIKHKKSVVMAAADTFRAAAIQQLEEHANRLGVKLIKHDYESDPAAVAFDAIKHAESKGIDVVLIDTAGRQHANKNLMRELEKVIRVNKPDLKVFIGESITGNDCIEQAKQFNEAVGIDVIVLTKADVDEKGGAAISISYVTGKPILYLGVGQNYDDLEPFNKEKILENVGL